MVGARTQRRLADATAHSTSTGRGRRVTLVDDKVDRHFTLQTADVSVTEVVAQLVHLPDTGPHTTHHDIHRIYLGGSVVGSLQSLGHWTCD